MSLKSNPYFLFLCKSLAYSWDPHVKYSHFINAIIQFRLILHLFLQKKTIAVDFESSVGNKIRHFLCSWFTRQYISCKFFVVCVSWFKSQNPGYIYFWIGSTCVSSYVGSVDFKIECLKKRKKKVWNVW